MKILVVYDSAYGNTEKVAQALAAAGRAKVAASAKQVKDATVEDVQASDVLVVGSPTQAGKPTQPIQEFVNKLTKDALKNKKVAAFDTRFAMNDHGFGLKIVMKTIGFAAPKIASKLTTKGGTLVTDPEGFIVADKDGPLKDGELRRAATWMNQIVKGTS